MPRPLIWILLCLTCVASGQRGDQRTYDLQDVNWSVRIDAPSRSIVGDVTNTVRLISDEQSLRFDSAQLLIDSAEVDGKPVEFDLVQDSLWVKIGHQARAGETCKVRIRYHGNPQAGVYFVPASQAYPATTDVVYTQGEMEDNRYWIPTYDFPDDKATSEGHIDVPKGWSVLSNGSLIDVKSSGDRSVFHWKIDKPHSTYLISFVAGELSEIADGKRKLPVSYWVPKGLEAEGKLAFGNTDDQIQIYEKLTGISYPWPKFSQVAVPDFVFGGMENVSAVTQSIGTLHTADMEPLSDSEGLVAHELAHQWFGDLVTCSDWSHVWINEGFATFMPAFIARSRRGEDAYSLERLGAFDGGFGAQHGGDRPVVWDKFKLPIDMFDGHAYAGGAARLHMLLHLVGEPAFWKGVHQFLTEYGYRNADTDQFFDVMSRSTGVDLDSFKKQWFYSPFVPSLSVSRSASGFMIDLKPKAMKLKVEYAILSPGQTTLKFGSVELNGTPATISAEPNSLVIVDPSTWLMANISYDYPIASGQWLDLYRVAPCAATKARLLQSMTPATSEVERQSLVKDEANTNLRARIVRTLSQPTLLVPYLKDQSPELRNAAAETLGHVPDAASAVSALSDVVDNEPNENVKIAAFQAIINITNDKTWVERANQTRGFRDEFRCIALRWWASHDPERAREEALRALSLKPSQPVRMTCIEVLGTVKDQPGSRMVYDTLVGFVNAPEIGPLRAALRALSNYGDKRAIAVIEPFKKHGLHFVRRDAESALDVLRR